jgi:hypothetical protein
MTQGVISLAMSRQARGYSFYMQRIEIAQDTFRSCGRGFGKMLAIPARKLCHSITEHMANIARGEGGVSWSLC